MLGKIKYSYIPKEKAIDAILSSLAYAMKATDAIDFMIIDNKSKGRRLYPNNVSANVMNCDKDELLDTIENLIEDDIDIIMVNDFDINLDELKEIYCKPILDSDTLLCVNNILELDNQDSNISIYIEPSIEELDDEEWECVKEEIIQDLEDVKLEKKETKNLKDSGISSLLDLFGLDNLYNKSNKKEIDTEDYDYEGIDFDLDVKEQYSYTVKDLELVVSLTDEDNILINNEEDFILIPKEQIKFLTETLLKLTDNKNI